MKHHHIHIFLLIGAVLIGLSLVIGNVYSEAINLKTPTQIGVSYSPEYAKNLRLDPKTTYQSILSDLDIKNLRLNAYWNEIEKSPGQYDFSELDYYIHLATEHRAKVYLAVGYKLPRWPECRAPKWLDKATTEERQANQLKFVQATIEKYNLHPAVVAFQIENEPLLEFGICPKPDREFLTREVAFVRKLTSKPIILTDSGELRSWVTPMKLSDIFGTTIYRYVFAPGLGNTRYPLQPWFYRVKSDLVRKIFAPQNQKTIIAELQAETWSDRALTQTPIKEQIDNYPLSEFQNALYYSRRIGFDEIYLWGVEWWYYMAAQDHPEYLEYAKGVFN